MSLFKHNIQFDIAVDTGVYVEGPWIVWGQGWAKSARTFREAGRIANATKDGRVYDLAGVFYKTREWWARWWNLALIWP